MILSFCCTTLGWTKKIKLFKEMIKTLFFNKTAVLKKPKESILLIQKQIKKKGLTKKGKVRKSRIYEKFIFQKYKTFWIANFYEAVLPMFKSFILIFEQKTPQVHKLHLKLAEVTKGFTGSNVSIRAWSNSNRAFHFVRLFEKISWFFSIHSYEYRKDR